MNLIPKEKILKFVPFHIQKLEEIANKYSLNKKSIEKLFNKKLYQYKERDIYIEKKYGESRFSGVTLSIQLERALYVIEPFYQRKK